MDFPVKVKSEIIRLSSQANRATELFQSYVQGAASMIEYDDEKFNLVVSPDGTYELKDKEENVTDISKKRR